MRIASPTGSTTQTLAESNGNSLPIVRLTGLEPDKTLHEIERHTVDFNRKHTAPRWGRSRQRAVSAARRCLKAAVFLTMAHSGRR